MKSFAPQGVCCKKIQYQVIDGCLHDVQFFGGCPGNGKAVARLVEGMDIILAMKQLRGITCGKKNTSCADQLVKALEEMEV